MNGEELYALTSSGTYHKRDCDSAANAKTFLPLDKLPAEAKPCGRCDPPPLPVKPAGAESGGGQQNQTPPQTQQNNTQNTPPPPPPPPKAKLGKARCTVACTAQGSFRKPGDVLTFPENAVNQHFKVIGD